MVKDYFPAVISKHDYDKVQAMFTSRSDSDYASRSDNRAPAAPKHLLAGLARCPVCGATMTRVTKGAKSSGPRLVCVRAKAGACEYRSVPVEHVEAALEATQDAVAALYEQMEHTTADVARKHIGEKLNDYLMDIKDLESQQSVLWKQMQQSSYTAMQARGERLEALVSSGDVVQANAVLRSLVSDVVIDYRNGVLVFRWLHGGESSLTYTMPA